MISVGTIAWLLLAHWLADFIFQSREMAEKKSASEKWLAYHVFTYTLVLAVMVGPTFALVNGVIHFCVDWVTSYWSSSCYQRKDFYAFFAVIGMDQMIHIITLVFTYIWLVQ